METAKLLKRALPEPIYVALRAAWRMPIFIFQDAMERCGFHVARANDFYSPLPSRRKLQSTMHRWSRPSSLRGIDYDLAGMEATVAVLVGKYYDEFAALLPYVEVCKLGLGLGYPRIDAIVLYCMLREKKPARYLEVGSGLSTYYACAAAQKNAVDGRPMQITCIEPYPAPSLATLPDISLRIEEVQNETLDVFTALGKDDVLFIDSSHIVRVDGDVPFLFLEVLPALQPGVLIHIHDIPFPHHGPYPAQHWIYGRTWPVWWNESMLLHALLCGNKGFRIALSAPLIRDLDEPFLKSSIPGYQTVEEEPDTFSSIWLQTVSA